MKDIYGKEDLDKLKMFIIEELEKENSFNYPSGSKIPAINKCAIMKLAIALQKLPTVEFENLKEKLD